MTEQPTALARLVAYLTGGFFLIYGASFALSPNAMLGLVTQYEIAGSSALVDFRATYGGLQLAVGVLILYLFQGGQVRTSLIASAAILFTMALFRSIGLASDGRMSSGSLFSSWSVMAQVPVRR